ncbi:replication initiation protein [Listeria monocytogenes]|nr:replication initiation protein [Listeria monocytogenes]
MNNKQLVVKDNILVEASYSLDLVEQRILLLSIITARENNQKIELGKPLIIHASKYAEVFNVDKKSAYDVLKSGADGLIGKSFSYYENNKSSKSNWVDTVAYVENGGFIEVIFTTKVVAFISELERRFTAYDINQVANLKNKYALRLYESLIQFKSVGKLNISLIELRERLGIESDSYSQMAMFKVRVLDLAVKQISDNTDIEVNYKQHKKGRTITGFTFTFKQKASKATAQASQRDEKTGDLFSIENMSDKQIQMFSKKLAELPELGSKYCPVGASTEQFAQMIASELKNPLLRVKYSDYLKKLGFKQSE